MPGNPDHHFVAIALQGPSSKATEDDPGQDSSDHARSGHGQSFLESRLFLTCIIIEKIGSLAVASLSQTGFRDCNRTRKDNMSSIRKCVAI
jgi:hypothetical protein